MAEDLTQGHIAAIKPDKTKRQEIPDGKIRGLYLRVQPVPSGAMSWAVRYRFEGKPSVLVLGSYPALSLKVGRELAGAALAQVARGVDPAAIKKADKAARQKASNAERHTVATTVQRFKAEYLEERTRPATAVETHRMLMKELVAAHGPKPLSAIEESDIVKIIAAVRKRGSRVMANRLQSRLKKFFGWAVTKKIIAVSPCTALDDPTPEQSRERVLSDRELKHIWQAAEAVGWPFGPLIQLLILTGARRDELAEGRWREIDLAAETWTLPRDRVKNKREHVIPLSAPALRILQSLPRVESKSELVFTTTGEAPVQGFSRARDRISALALASLRKETNDLHAELPHWTIHDLRRTLATGLQRLRVDLIVVEKILNHTSGSLRGVAGIYARHEFTEERRSALEAWARHMHTLTGGEAVNNVVALRA